MIEKYATDEDLAKIYNDMVQRRSHKTYSLNEGLLIHGPRLCVVKDLCEKVMYVSQSPPYVGHCGIQPTTQAIVTYFCWPSMRKDIQDYVNECIVCQKVNYDRGKTPRLLQPLPILDGP